MRATWLVIALWGFAQSAAEAREVDLELVLAVDVSSSISRDEYLLQVTGLAAAFRSPEVVAAIRNFAPRGIAVTLLQWASIRQERQTVPWRHLRDESSAQGFAAEIEGMRRIRPRRRDGDRRRDTGRAPPLRRQRLRGRAPRDRRLGRRALEPGPGNRPGQAAGGGGRHHHQRPADFERAASPRRLLPPERHRRPRRLRAGGGRLHRFRPRHPRPNWCARSRAPGWRRGDQLSLRPASVASRASVCERCLRRQITATTQKLAGITAKGWRNQASSAKPK